MQQKTSPSTTCTPEYKLLEFKYNNCKCRICYTALSMLESGISYSDIQEWKEKEYKRIDRLKFLRRPRKRKDLKNIEKNVYTHIPFIKDKESTPRKYNN